MKSLSEDRVETISEPLDHKPSRKHGRKLIVWIGWILVCLVVIEVGLRLGGVHYAVGGKELFFAWDPQTGIAPRPGAEGWWHTAEYNVWVHINSQGLRDREHSFQKPAGAFRVAVLGDSYTEALQVPAEKDDSSVLEQRLGTCPALGSMKPEVINFGVNGFTTAQQLLRLREKVWQYGPDVVVLAFDSGNNVYKNSRALQQDPYRPYFVEKGDGSLVLDDSFLHAPGVRARRLFDDLTSWSIQHSRLLQVIAAATNYLREGNTEGLTPTGMGLEPSLYRPPDTPEWKQAWRVTEDLIDQIRNETIAHHAKFLLVTLSSSIQVDPNPAVRQAFVAKANSTDLLYPDHRLEQFAIAKGIPVLTLAPYFQTYAQEHQVYLHGQRFDHQGLLNELGHRLAGEAMAAKICTEVVSPGN